MEALYPEISPNPITPTKPMAKANGSRKNAKNKMAAKPIKEIDSGSIS
jgi:hypothetical protein